MTRLRRIAVAAALLAPAAALAPRAAAGADRFRADDPIAIDRDDLPSPLPGKKEISDYYDVLENTFFPQGDDARTRALDINTVGEVPDSSWFTNRIGTGRMTREELVRGPDTSGPAPGAWTVAGAKSQGITPGFRIEDAKGNRYLIKFDPPSNPELATSAEVISTKILHAIGFNVPENYVAVFDPADLRIGEGVSVTDELGRKVPLDRARLDRLLAGVARQPDGRVRALASRFVPGKILGPFEFRGTRRDDPNDIVPHEHRRVLRGYRVFCAWLNHDDSRAINTSDFYVGKEGEGHVKHYLLDFGSTLGSASTSAQNRMGGNEYFWEPDRILASVLTLGIWIRPWVNVEYPDRRLPSVGRFEAEFFRPGDWRPEYPNMAFDRLDAEDAFWAARLVMRFGDDDLRAIVRTGQLSDPAAEDYLARALIRRRDKIGDHWLRGVNPLDGFRIVDDALVFENVLERYGFEPQAAPQTATVSGFHNASDARSATPLAEPKTLWGGSLTLPREVLEAAEGAHFVVRLANGPHHADVFLRRRGGRLQVVGLERR